MEPEKIRSVVALYRTRFEAEGIPKKRMAVEQCCPKTKEEMLAHAHYLLDGVDEFSRNPEKVGKTGRHLASVQTLLVVTGWYSLEDVMNHNKP